MSVPRQIDSRRAAAAAALIAGLAALAGPSVATGSGIVPHRAVYTLSRHHASKDPEIVAVKGRMEVTLAGGCDGWRLEQFLGFRMLGADQTELEHVAQLSGFETSGGREFWFNARTFEDREVVEELSGVARRGPGGNTVRYALPEPATENLPPDTLFPMAHLDAILDAARAGKPSMSHTVFDGTTLDNPFEVSTFVAGKLEGSRAAPPAALAGLRGWRLRLAYYGARATEPAPDFEMSADLYDNGVIGDMVYDYGDLEIAVQLDEVDVDPVPDCAPGKGVKEP